MPTRPPLARLALLALAIASAASCGGRDPGRAAAEPDGVVVDIPRLDPPPPVLPPTDVEEEPGLDFDLRAAPDAAPTRPAGGARAVPMDPAAAAALLARLPALPPADPDTFRFAAASPPPPRAGATIRAPFPPADTVAAPAPEPPAPPPEPLEVTRITPAGEAGMVPEVTVVFSRPVAPLATLAALDSAAVPVRIRPRPPGRWSWLDPRTLRFEPEGRLPMATEYRVEVPSGVRAADGGALAEGVVHTFRTPPPRAVGAYPNRGAPAPELGPVGPRGRRPAPPEGEWLDVVTGLEPVLFLAFDQRVDPAAVLPRLALRAAGLELPLRLATAAEIAADSAVARLVRAAEPGRWVAVRAVRPLPRDTEVRVSVLPGTPSAEGPLWTTVTQRMHFRTFGPLRLLGLNCGVEPDEECPPDAPWVVRFSNPLDTAAWRDELVRVDPALPGLAVRVEGHALLLTGDPRPGTVYRVALAAGIADRFGQRLSEEVVRTVRVGHGAPLLSLTGAPFIVLDPAGPPRVVVRSRGHGALRVRVHRVGPSLWPAYSAAVRRLRERNGAGTLDLPGEPVVDRVMEVGAGGGFAETLIDLSPALSGGLGHAVVVVEPAGAPPAGESARGWRREPTHAWVQATRLGPSAMVDRGELVAWVSSLRDGAPVPGATVQLLPAGTAATTGPDGMARMTLADAPGNLLVVRQGQDSAILPENPYGGGEGDGWRRAEQEAALRWLVFSDRGLYRPGERVRLKGWVRRAELDGGTDLALPGTLRRVQYTAFGPREEELGRGAAAATGLAGFDLALQLPDALNLGHARIDLRAEGTGLPEEGAQSSTVVQVDEFRRPEYQVDIETRPGPHVVGDTLPATLRAAYYSGGSLPGSAVRWRAHASPGQWDPPGWDGWSFGRTGWWDRPQRAEHRTLQGTTGPRGEHRVLLGLRSADPPFPSRLRLEAEVGDLNRQVGSASADLLVHAARLYPGLRLERAWVRPGDSLAVEVAAVDLDGRAVAGSRVTVTARRVEGRWFPAGATRDSVAEATPVCAVDTGAEPARCHWRAPGGGAYRLTAETRDADGRPSRTEVQLWVAGGDPIHTPDRPDQADVSLVPDRPEYQPGDTAELLVRSAIYPAEGVLSLRLDGVEQTRRFRMETGSQALRLPVTEAMIPGAVVRVEVVDVRTGVRTGSAEARLAVPPLRRELAVRVLPRDSTLRPGATTSVEVEVRTPDGRPAAGAEVALWMVDEAILDLGAYQLPDPLAAFYPERYPRVQDLALRPHVLLAPRSAGPGTVSGVLLDPQTGQPRPGARVSIAGLEGQAVTGPDGSFTLAGVPPGRQTLAVDGGATLRREVEVPAEGVHLGTLLTRPEPGDRMRFLSVEEMAPRPSPAPPMAFQQLDARAVMGGVAAGAAKASTPIALRARFAPLALFEPALRTGADGRVRATVRVPESLTRYRVMAVAVEGARRFGRGEATVTARRDLMVRPSAPRFLNFGDRAEIPVLVQNDGDRELRVRVAARGSGIRLEAPHGFLVTLAAGDRVELRFPATATRAGTARLQVAASAGQETDAAAVEFPVYTPATAEAFALPGEVDSDGPVLLPLSVPGGVLPDFGGAEVTVSSTALQELTDAVLYLHRYPFEGAEPIASRVLAISALRDVLAAFRAEGLPPADSLEESVRRDLARLAALQGPEGGWSPWRPDRPADPYVSVHVAHALQRAREAGFAIPDGALPRALDYLRALDRQEDGYPPRARLAVRAYALYVRDRAGDPGAAPAAASLAASARSRQPLSPLPLEAAAWLLSVLADQPGSPERAELLRSIRNRATGTAATATFATDYTEGEYLLLHSAQRSDAVVLDALIAADPASDLVPRTARGLLAHRTRGRWAGTQENAWALLALQSYFRRYEATTPRFTSRLWLGQRFAGSHTFAGRTTERHHLVIPMSAVLAADSAAALTLARQGEGRMYFRAALRYAPADLTLDPLRRGFTVGREYRAVDDSTDVRRDAYGNWRIRAGARVRVHLTLVAPARRHHVALVDPLPAGLEPLNPELRGTGLGEDPPPDGPRALSRIAAPDDLRWGGWWTHQNLRDDRAEAFADLLGAGRYEYTYLARATTPGIFVVPPARAEEMYSPETFGRTGTARVIVE